MFAGESLFLWEIFRIICVFYFDDTISAGMKEEELEWEIDSLGIEWNINQSFHLQMKEKYSALELKKRYQQV